MSCQRQLQLLCFVWFCNIALCDISLYFVEWRFSYQTVRSTRPRYAQPAYPFILVRFAKLQPWYHLQRSISAGAKHSGPPHSKNSVNGASGYLSGMIPTSCIMCARTGSRFCNLQKRYARLQMWKVMLRIWLFFVGFRFHRFQVDCIKKKRELGFMCPYCLKIIWCNPVCAFIIISAVTLFYISLPTPDDTWSSKHSLLFSTHSVQLVAPQPSWDCMTEHSHLPARTSIAHPSLTHLKALFPFHVYDLRTENCMYCVAHCVM